MTNFDHWNHLLKDVESPDSWIKWGFYSMISAALQRRVWIGDGIYPNMFNILVGPPGLGKGRVLGKITDIFKDATMLTIGTDASGKTTELPRFPYGADSTTKGSITKELAQTVKLVTYEVEGGKKKLLATSPMVFIIEELATLFKGDSEDLVNLLNHLYDSRHFDYVTKHGAADIIRNLCVTFVAGTTPSFIKDNFTKEVMSQGFTARALLIHEEKKRFNRLPRSLEESQLASRDVVIKHLKLLYDKPVAGPVKLSKEAENFMAKLYESGDITEKRLNPSHRLEDYYSRKMVHWHKLAMAIHFAESTEMIIPLAPVEKALAMLNEAEPQMHRAYDGNGLTSSTRAAVFFLQKIHRGGAIGLTISELKGVSALAGLPDQTLYDSLNILQSERKILNLKPESRSAQFVSTSWKKPWAEVEILF